jgi:hypothetical protein
MCLMSVFPAGVPVNMARLRQGTAVCGNGHGWAVGGINGIKVCKGMDAEYALESFARCRALHPDAPALFHSRWATRGSGGLENCQPFFLGTGLVFAHQGTVPGLTDGKRSDSRVLAEEVIPPLLWKDRWVTEVREALKGTNGVLMGRRTAVVLDKTQGHWLDGAWYSNSDWLPAGKADGDTAWLAGLSNLTARKTYRVLGEAALDLWGAGQVALAEEMNSMRATIVEAFPELQSGAS